MMNLSCPHCARNIQLSPQRFSELRGRKVKCPGCGGNFLLEAGDQTRSEAVLPPAPLIQPDAPAVHPLPLAKLVNEPEAKNTTAPADSSAPAASSSSSSAVDPSLAELGKLAGRSRTARSGLTAAELLARRRLAKRRAITWMAVGTSVVGLIIAGLVYRALPPTRPAVEYGLLLVDVSEQDRQLMSLRIDGVPCSFDATGPIEHRLPVGACSVRLQRAGYEDYPQTVMIKAGLKATVRPTWKRLAMPEREPMPPAVADSGLEQKAEQTSDRVFVFKDWLQDLDEARARAAEQGKDLLVLFDGSDWCGYSIKMTNEVFSHPECKSLIETSFVPVFIDFPRHENVEYVQNRERNRQTANQFGVSGFPTVILLDSDGRPYSQFGSIDEFAQFKLLMNEVVDFRKQREEARREITELLANGRVVPAALLDKFAAKQEKGYHVPQFWTWKQMAGEADPDNRNGLNEQFLTAWVKSVISLIDVAPPGQSRLEALQHAKDEVLNWQSSLKFKDEEQASLMFLALAGVFRMIDTGAAIQLAQAGNALHTGTAEVDAKLSRLASDIISGGSGFLVSKTGLVVTNAHVVAGHPVVTVEVEEGRERRAITARVMAADPEADLALLQLDEGNNLPFLALNDKPVVNLLPVFVAGYPLLRDDLTTTPGMVSSPTAPTADNMIAITATVNPGNSGGPLLNKYGQVVGIVAGKRTSSKEVDSEGYAIGIEKLQTFLERTLEPAAYRLIRFEKDKRQNAEPAEMIAKTRSAIVRIVIKLDLISEAEAQSRNQQNWQTVLQAGLPQDEYEKAAESARQVVLAWPKGEHWRTLALASYRLGRLEEAIEATQGAVMSDWIRLGLPHAGTFLIGTLLAQRAGYQQASQEYRDSFESLRDRMPAADAAWMNQLEGELSREPQP